MKPPTPLDITDIGPVRLVRFDRPERHNAFNAAMHELLLRFFQDLPSDLEARAVVLTGAGRSFSSGGDRETIELAHDPHTRRQFLQRALDLAHAMLDCPLPVIAAVNGPAVGLGCSIALLSDIVIMAESAHLADTHVRIGLVAGDGGPLIWPFLTSMAVAKHYLLTGDNVDAQTANKLGLVSRVLPDDEVVEHAMVLAQRLSALPWQAVQGTKKALNLHLKMAAQSVLEFAVQAERESFALPDFWDRLKEQT